MAGTEEKEKKQKRWVVDDFIGPMECAELIFLYRSNAVVGYRDHFSVATLREPLAFDNWGHLLPLVRIREKLRDAVEERTGEHLSLFVEWTGLSCWHPRSSIPAHYDSNRPYLEQRHYSVVLYLNDAGKGFDGGTFQFFDDRVEVPQEEVHAVAGRLLIFSSGPENVHGVTPVTRGERFTFTVWLTRDEDRCEDRKILSYLPSSVPHPSSSLDLFSVFSPPPFFDPNTTTIQRHLVDQPPITSMQQGFNLEAELMDRLEMEVWTRETQRKKRRKRRRDDSPDEGTNPPSSLQDEEEEEDEESVVVRWRGRVVPLRFDSLRRAIELMAFIAWQRQNNVNEPTETGRSHEEDEGHAIDKGPTDDVEEEEEDMKWRRRVTDWMDYRTRLDEGLRRALPKWKDAECLYDYQPHDN